MGTEYLTPHNGDNKALASRLVLPSRKRAMLTGCLSFLLR